MVLKGECRIDSPAPTEHMAISSRFSSLFLDPLTLPSILYCLLSSSLNPVGSRFNLAINQANLLGQFQGDHRDHISGCCLYCGLIADLTVAPSDNALNQRFSRPGHGFSMI